MYVTSAGLIPYLPIFFLAFNNVAAVKDSDANAVVD